MPIGGRADDARQPWNASARTLMPSSILRIIAKSPNSISSTLSSGADGFSQS